MTDNKSLFGSSYQRVATPAQFERGMLGQAAADGIAMASMLPTDPLAAAARLGVAQAPVLAEMGTSSLRKLFGLEDPRLAEAQAQAQANNEALGIGRSIKAMYFQDLAESVEDEGLRTFLQGRSAASLAGQFDGTTQEDLDKLVTNAFKNFGQEFKDVPAISEEEAERGVDILTAQFPGQEELLSNPVVLDQIWTIKNRYKKEMSWAEAAQVFMQRYSKNLEDAFANLEVGSTLPRGLDAGSPMSGMQPGGTAITAPSVQSYQEGARAALESMPDPSLPFRQRLTRLFSTE